MNLADSPVASYLYLPRTLISRKKTRSIRQANMLNFITCTLRTSAAAHAAIVAQSKFNDTHDEQQTVDTTTNSATSTSDDDETFSNTQQDGDAVELEESEMDGVEDESKYDIMNFVSSKVWGVPSLREDQVSAIDKLLFDKDADGKMLGVAHTGGYWF